MSSFHEIWLALLQPFLALFDPSKRVFIPFLLGSLVLALWANYRRGRHHTWLRALFPRAVYLHPSALVDYRLLFVKALVRVLLFAPLFVSTLSITAAVAALLREHLGAASPTSLSALSVGALYTLSAFLFDDWSRYALHRVMHRVPFLWELHKVHHSAEVLTPLTLYRTHPIESLLNSLRGSLSLGLASGLFVWGFGGHVQGWQILGVDAIGFVWSLLGANLRHSHVWISYGPRWERLLLSPAQHQIHHSEDAAHRDRNFGTVLSLWDWLGGSLYVTGAPEELRFGLGPEQSARYRSVASLLLSPLSSSLQAALVMANRPRCLRASALAAVLLLSCDVGTRFDRAPLLRGFAECAVTTYREVSDAANLLQVAVKALAEAPSASTQEAARVAWQQAIDRVQQAELMQFGPAAKAPSPGAQGLRSAIYSWPDVNRCLIEQQLVHKTYQSDLFAATPENTRGLSTLEYLLFYAGRENACDASVDINASGTWAALSDDELARRKRAYAQAAAQDVVARAQTLLATWETAGFAAQLGSSGQGSTIFPSQQAGLSAVAEGLFYLDETVKDRKLAVPLGLRDCPQASCPAATESPWAKRSISHLRNNLIGFRRLFLGCGPQGEGLGFDDLMNAAGAAELRSRMTADLNAALLSVDALKSPDLATAVANEREAVLGIYDAIKRITDALKSDFTVVLQINPPKRVEGDND